jgi:hypothetical protein
LLEVEGEINHNEGWHNGWKAKTCQSIPPSDPLPTCKSKFRIFCILGILVMP